MLSDYFVITYLCDVSQNALEYCSSRIASRPRLTTSVSDVCSSSEVDAVLICNSSALHATHATLALKNNKHVFVEKPVTYNYRDIDALIAAEQNSTGAVFVGYMRRYAPAFIAAINEIGDKTKIQYARIRSIMGPNSAYVQQSGTYPKRFDDMPQAARTDVVEKDRDMKEQALTEFGVPITDKAKTMLFWLGALASHDVSAMREALGFPLRVRGAYMQPPIWSAIFEYDSFSVTYESGVNAVPDFDAHVELYTDAKIVQVKYDQPYIKGLPTTMMVRERITGRNGQVGFQKKVVRETFEDNYTLELLEWYDCIVNGRTPKTTLQDARQDLDIFKMLIQAGFGKIDK